MRRYTPILPLLFMLSCAPSATVGTPGVSSRQQFYNHYTTALKDINAVYEAGMKTVGKLGTPEQKAQAIAIGKTVAAALQTAKDALVAYIKATDESGAQVKLFNAFADTNRLIADLTKLVGTFKR